MEREIRGRVVFETAKLAGAAAIHGFIMRSPLAAKYKEMVIASEAEPDVIDWGRLNDFEEYETGHELTPNTFLSIFRHMHRDLDDRKEDSPVAAVRTNEQGAFAIQDLKKLAEDLTSRKAIVPGIGRKRAAYLLDGASVLIAIADGDYPDRPHTDDPSFLQG